MTNLFGFRLILSWEQQKFVADTKTVLRALAESVASKHWTANYIYSFRKNHNIAALLMICHCSATYTTRLLVIMISQCAAQ